MPPARTATQVPDADEVHAPSPERAGNRQAFLTNRFVELADPMPSHYPTLYGFVRPESVVDRWQAGSQSFGYDTFVQRFWVGVLAQFVFSRPGEREIAGLVKCELPNFRHQTAQLGLYASGESQGQPLPMMALATFIDFVFETYPLRKLYAEVPGFNFGQFESGDGRFFVVEGRLTDHEIHFGRTWDTFILAVNRDIWRDQIGAGGTAMASAVIDADLEQLRSTLIDRGYVVPDALSTTTPIGDLALLYAVGLRDASQT